MHIKISMAPMYLKFYLMVNEAADDSLLMSCFYFEIYEFEMNWDNMCLKRNIWKFWYHVCSVVFIFYSIVLQSDNIFFVAWNEIDTKILQLKIEYTIKMAQDKKRLIKCDLVRCLYLQLACYYCIFALNHSTMNYNESVQTILFYMNSITSLWFTKH